MPRRATDRDLQTFSGSYSSEDREPTGSHMPAQTPGGSSGPPMSPNGPKLWSVLVFSVLGSAVAVSAAGCFCSLMYPILKELRSERVRREDGTEVRMLGLWSILLLSLVVGCICCFLSWTLTYLHSHQSGEVSPKLLTLAHFRDVSGHGFHLDYGISVLNGVMAALTVIWSLT